MSPFDTLGSMRDSHFIHLSDSHLGPDESYALHGVNTYQISRKIVNHINELVAAGTPVDFVVHTGDITGDGDDSMATGASVKLAAELFGELNVPFFLINGNHDNRSQLFNHLEQATRLEPLVDEVECLAGTCRVGDDTLAFLDARHPPALSPRPVEDPAGYLPAVQLQALQILLEQELTNRISIFLHYPPVPLDSLWLDRIMLISNGADLHKLLCQHRDKVAGVFFGHIHQSLQRWMDGILYSAVGSLSCQFSSWPNDREVQIGQQPLGNFQYVALTRHGTLLKQQTLIIE